jgi:hypothetical protein
MLKFNALFFAVCLVANSAFAATIYVPDDYPGIKSAVEAAASGDMIIVAAGTYSGPDNRNIDFAGKNLDLIAASGSEVTVINCENSGFGIRIQDMTEGAASIQGFRINNAIGGNGAGIIINRSNHVTVSNCIINNCSASLNGGGVYIGYSTSSTFIDNCDIYMNEAQFRGAGLMVDHASETFISDSIIRGNTLTGANYGGGGIHDNASTYVSVERCTFSGNQADGVGNALHFAGNIFVYNSLFRATVPNHSKPAFPA